MANNPAHAIDSYREQVQAAAAVALKTLLETKHLYQSVAFDYPDEAPLIAGVIHEFQGVAARGITDLADRDWLFIDPVAGQGGESDRICVLPPDVKLFCRICDRVEAFNLVSVENFLRRGAAATYTEGGKQVAALVLSFLCQSCKFVPEVFIVRLHGSRLTLCGRSPMETVQVPGMIPKSMRRAFSSAVVAHQSGQTLAANFLLRVLVETWARSQVEEIHDKADELMDAYVAILPQPVREHFPSLRAVYAELSADMHAGIGSPELFEKALADIERHFDARRLFKVEDRTPQAQPTSRA